MTAARWQTSEWRHSTSSRRSTILARALVVADRRASGLSRQRPNRIAAAALFPVEAPARGTGSPQLQYCSCSSLRLPNASGGRPSIAVSAGGGGGLAKRAPKKGGRGSGEEVKDLIRRVALRQNTGNEQLEGYGPRYTAGGYGREESLGRNNIWLLGAHPLPSSGQRLLPGELSCQLLPEEATVLSLMSLSTIVVCINAGIQTRLRTLPVPPHRSGLHSCGKTILLEASSDLRFAAFCPGSEHLCLDCRSS